jgi:hypothetical protein
MVEFTDLAGTAIANAENRSELIASRARVLAASDETRRRIERGRHSTRPNRRPPSCASSCTGSFPPVLTRSGLRAAVEALAKRMSVPVKVSVHVDRLPPAVEATAYFVMAEALTNVAKHSGARHAAVEVHVDDGVLRIRVRDTRRRGAARGPRVRGVADRLAALDGQLRAESPAGAGTLITADIPLQPVI